MRQRSDRGIRFPPRALKYLFSGQKKNPPRGWRRLEWGLRRDTKKDGVLDPLNGNDPWVRVKENGLRELFTKDLNETLQFLAFGIGPGFIYGWTGLTGWFGRGQRFESGHRLFFNQDPRRSQAHGNHFAGPRIIERVSFLCRSVWSVYPVHPVYPCSLMQPTGFTELVPTPERP